MQIKEFILFKWITESNRLLHLKYAILPSLLFTMFFGFGLSIGMEFKDKLYGNKFDWLDILATFIGSIIGQIIQIIIIALIIYLIRII